MESSGILGWRAEGFIDQSTGDGSGLGNDPDSHEELILAMDSYWDELSDRVAISRMVSDSITRGMVNAIQQETDEKIALKEAEVAILKQKLQHYESGAAKVQECDFVKQLHGLRIAPGNELETQPEGNSTDEEKWEEEIRKEISSTMVQNAVKAFQDEFEAKFCEQRSGMNTMCKKWQKSIEEILTMRGEIDAIYKSVFSIELAPKIVKNHSVEEIGSNVVPIEKSDEFGVPTATDSPQLMCMKKEELISYFRTELTKMKRQHDTALQEKTEELFILKREHLKEKGSTPLHLRKEKELELMRKKFGELISKLDEVLMENEKRPTVHEDENMLYSLKNLIGNLLVEKQWLLLSLLQDKREARSFASLLSSVEANHREVIKKLQADMEDTKVEAAIKDEIHKVVLKGLVGEFEGAMQDLDKVTKILEDNYSFVYGQIMRDAFSTTNAILTKSLKEKESLKVLLLEKEQALIIGIEENNRLKQQISSITMLMEEKEKLALEAGSTLVKQKEDFDLVCQELNVLREQVSRKDKIISDSKRETGLMKGRFNECLQQIHQYEVEISALNQKLEIVSNALKEAESQKNIFLSNIQEKQEMLAAKITKEKEQKKQLDSIIISMTQLSKAIGDCECRVAQNMDNNETRLKILNHQCRQLVQEANLLRIKGLLYKERFEKTRADLEKAENEVDLLGDDVDALLGLLEKIYMALDHYSPVLQHYPGVMEILKLIRRELKAGSTKLA